MSLPYLRSLAKAPGYSILVILTLALGIGAATALFSVVNAVLLQPLAFRDAGKLVAIHTSWPAKGRTSPRITGGDFMDLRSRVHSLSGMAVYSGGEIGVRLGEHARFARVFQADPAFFHVLDLTPAMGRLPGSSDAGQSVVLALSFARANWNDAAHALGQSVRVDNKPYSVIGIVDDKLAFPERAEVWITGPVDPENRNHSAFNYYAVGRIRPDVSMPKAQAELAATVALQSNEGKLFRLLSLQEDMTGSSRTTLLFLFGAAGLLLFIACANVANLMLARTASRAREVAVRIALGANTASIARMLLAEGCVLGCAAAATGLLLAYVAVRAVAPLIPATVPRAADAIPVHTAVLVFAGAVACLTVAACSLTPALQLRKIDLAEVMKQAAGRGIVGGSMRSRQIIVIAQVAFCCILSVGAVLLSRTLLALLHAPLGYRTEDRLVMYADAPAFGLPQYLQAIRTFEATLEGVRRMPGVQSAAAAMGLPTGRYGSNGKYLVEGVHVQPGQDIFKSSMPRDLPEAVFALASEQYFETLEIPLIAGRGFTPRDRYDAPFTAIVSRSLARQSFGDSNPIGRRIYCGLDSPKPMTIVGVVGDVRQQSPGSKPEPEIYMPFQQHPFYANELQVVIHASANPQKLITGVRQIALRIAPTMAISFTTLDEMVHESVAAPRFRSALILAFAVLAVTLAMTGVYSVMAFYVSERKMEMGLRLALGAGRASIPGLILQRALFLTFAGLSIGIAAALALSRFVDSLLYGVRGLDPLAYGIGAGIVLAAMALASFIPSWQAGRVDPIVALRNE